MNSQQKLRLHALSKIELLGDSFLVEFINDTVSFHLKNERVPFLTKYAQVLGGANYVVPIREFLKDIVKSVLRSTSVSSSLDAFRQSVYDRFGAERK